jgi:hypothetical protein
MAVRRASQVLHILVALLALTSQGCSRRRGKALGVMARPTNPVIVGANVYVDAVVYEPEAPRPGDEIGGEPVRIEVPLAGGTPRLLPMVAKPPADGAAQAAASKLGDVSATVRDGADLFVGTSFHGDGRPAADRAHPAGVVARIHLPGATPVVLATAQSVGELALDAGGIYLRLSTTYQSRIADGRLMRTV